MTIGTNLDWRNSFSSSSSLVKVRHLLVQVRARHVAMHRPERTNWSLVIDRLRPPADLSRRGPLMMPASRAFVHSDAPWTRSCGAEETRTPDFLQIGRASCRE